MTLQYVNKPIKFTLVCILAFTAIVSVGQLVYKSYLNNGFDNERWGLDYYQFWLGGKYVLAGVNPYVELYRQRYDEHPDNIFHAFQNQPKQIHKVPIVPASAPILLLMAPLSLLPWVSATLIWFLANIALGILFVWIFLRHFDRNALSLDGLLLMFLFFSLIGTRQVFELGQTSLIVAALMWLSFLTVTRNEMLSGFFLGIAFSKFTIALPMLLYFAYKRKIKVIFYCCLTQILGLLILCIVTKSSPVSTIAGYLDSTLVILHQTESYAIHLASMPWGSVPMALMWVITAVTFIVTFWFCFRKGTPQHENLSSLTLISIFSFWSLLVLYHGRQDMVISLPFIALVCFGTVNRESSVKPFLFIPYKESIFIWVVSSIIFSIWILPLYFVTGLDFYRSLFTATMLGAFIICLRLFISIRANDES